MALIPCPECKATVSDQASACPQCGYPLTQSRSIGDGASQGAAAATASAQATSDSPQLPRQTVEVVKQAKSRGIYIILGLFFGLLGIHNFYAGYLGRGVAQLLIILITGWFVVGLVVVATWIIFELFYVTQDAAGDAFV